MPSEKENMTIDVAEEPVKEMPNVEELLKILIDLNMAQEQQTVHLLMNYMNDVEENFYNVLEELDMVKEQLHQIQQTPQSKTLRYRLTEVSGQLEQRISAMQEKIGSMRATLNEKAGKAVQKFKEHGVTALNHVCETLGIKEMIVSLRDDLLRTAGDMQASIDKIDRVSQELRETATHTRNIGRALSGKETLATPEAKEHGFFHHIKRPYQGMKQFCLRKAGEMDKGIAKLEALEQGAGQIQEGRKKLQEQGKDKPSIMDKLTTYQKSQGVNAPAATQNKKKENVL